MKLLVCTTEFYPYGSGIANVAYNITEHLKRKGVDCYICSPTGPNFFLGSQRLIAKFGRIGILYYWYCVSSKFKKNNQFDIIWFHQPMFLSKNPFLKSLSTIHITTKGHLKAAKSLNYSLPFKFYLIISSIIEKYCFINISKSTKFITDSFKVSQELMEIMGSDTPYEYIPNGVDTNRFKPLNKKSEVRGRYNISANSVVFLTVGRLVSQKKLFLMIDIFRQIQEDTKNFFLIIAGRGRLFQKLNEYINKEHLDNIKLIGFVSDDDLPLLYSCADYFIMTSEYEGHPLSLLEAMASGLPCIVSDIPSLQIVNEANCGIVVDFSNKELASKIIIDYLKKYNLTHGENGRKYAEKYLDWDIISSKYREEMTYVLKIKSN